MINSNLYWSVYKNLEHEILQLSNQIHFDENQLSVYSIKITELLIRTSVEIEAISKELYFQNDGVELLDEAGKIREVYFDTDCLDYLENKWLLSHKKVLVTATTFYFKEEENKVLTPLKKANKRGSSGADWKKAYQAVKHNRANNLESGNIKVLIRAMAALFLLNLYYRDEKRELGTFMQKENLETRFGSDIFSIKSTYISFADTTGEVSLPIDFNECVYLKKLTDSAFLKVVSAAKKDFEEQLKAIIESSEFKLFMERNPNYSFAGKHLLNLCEDIGGNEFMKKIFQLRSNSMNLTHNSSLELVLNKNQKIFPNIE